MAAVTAFATGVHRPEGTLINSGGANAYAERHASAHPILSTTQIDLNRVESDLNNGNAEAAYRRAKLLLEEGELDETLLARLQFALGGCCVALSRLASADRCARQPGKKIMIIMLVG